ncbi:MAG: acyl-[acyl-carrier-protein]--UDP-N-acetylglucosamine O-acyltransferase, partial [Deltaproteobacteria bacterium]|nr:acyl-[acyl-carrier-protein]--UDP-N-acetylglucosamine O-acyltransferase [Deltaproteobacteria bacterium]
GERCEIYSYASVGTPPQDLKFDGRRTETIVGNDNTIREFVTINRGSVGGDELTKIGDNNLFMAYSHVAHDSIIGNHVVMANAATLAGHVTVGDHATLGGLSAVHQFVRIGTHAYIGGKTGVTKDIPPYMLVSGHRAKLAKAQELSRHDAQDFEAVLSYLVSDREDSQRSAGGG